MSSISFNMPPGAKHTASGQRYTRVKRGETGIAIPYLRKSSITRQVMSSSLNVSGSPAGRVEQEGAGIALTARCRQKRLEGAAITVDHERAGSSREGNTEPALRKYRPLNAENQLTATGIRHLSQHGYNTCRKIGNDLQSRTGGGGADHRVGPDKALLGCHALYLTTFEHDALNRRGDANILFTRLCQGRRKGADTSSRRQQFRLGNLVNVVLVPSQRPDLVGVPCLMASRSRR